MIAVLLLVTFNPILTMWIPNMMYGR
jgi:hypothetical protein